MSKPPDASHLPRGREGVYTIADFRFESGESLPELRVGYVQYGELNAARDNLLLLVPGTGNLRHSAIGHVGPGRAYDTDHYCVVCTDAIGGGTSSQPSDGLGGAFPRYTIRDMVHAQYRLVRDGLGMGDTPIAVLAGASMGGFQTLEWVINYPGSVRNAVMLVPGWRSGNLIRLTTSRMFDMIRLDPKWSGGHYTQQPLDGLGAAGRHYFPWTVTDEYIDSAPREQVEAEAAGAGDWFQAWDAWNITRRYEASTAHDVSAPFGGDLRTALARVDARVLVLPCTQDRLLGVQGAKDIAEGIRGAEYRAIESLKGHLAWRAVPGSPQTRFVTDEVRRFLRLPVAQESPSAAAAVATGEG
jgi:homoserine O-acetyltransferase